MKILVTGGAGYLGTELCVKLSNKSEVSQVIVLDDLSKKDYNFFLHAPLVKGKIKFVKASILDTRTMAKLIAEVDVVYNLATCNSQNENDHHLQEQINHWGTAQLTYALEESNVKQYIHISSSEVYGDSRDEFNVESEPAPISSYAQSMYRGEKHVGRLSSKMKTQIIRMANVFGMATSMDSSNFVNDFILKSSWGIRLHVEGNGEYKKAFINVERAAEALTALLDSDLKSGTYNFAELNISPMDIIEILMKEYTDTEMIFTNNHLQMSSTALSFDSTVSSLLGSKCKDLNEEVLDYKNSNN